MKNNRNNIIEDWLKQYGDPEISKQVEQEANELFEEQQKQHIIDMMQEDEKLGLYDKPKQETLEEASNYYAHNYFNMHETNNYKALKQGFEAGVQSNFAKEYWFKQFEKL